MSSVSHRDDDPIGPASDKEAIWELIKTLVLGKVAAEDILELYYWSRDPEMLNAVRAIAYLPEQSRLQILRFFADADSEAIRVAMQSPQHLTLTKHDS